MKTWVEVQGCRGPTVRPAQTVPHEKAAVPETADGDRALLPMLFEVLSASPDADGRFSGPREDGALDGGEHRLIRRDHQRFQRDDLDAATVPPLPRGVSGRSRRGGRSRVGYYRSLPLAAQLPCVAPPSEATETYDEVPRLGMGGHRVLSSHSRAPVSCDPQPFFVALAFFARLQRTRTALRISSLRCPGESPSHRALPPFFPRSCARTKDGSIDFGRSTSPFGHCGAGRHERIGFQRLKRLSP